MLEYFVWVRWCCIYYCMFWSVTKYMLEYFVWVRWCIVYIVCLECLYNVGVFCVGLDGVVVYITTPSRWCCSIYFVWV